MDCLDELHGPTEMIDSMPEDYRNLAVCSYREPMAEELREYVTRREAPWRVEVRQGARIPVPHLHAVT